MKSTIRIFMFILFAATQQIMCSKPGQSMPTIDEKKPFDMTQHQRTVAQLGEIKHKKRLNNDINKKLHEESMPRKTIMPAKAKPAC